MSDDPKTPEAFGVLDEAQAIIATMIGIRRQLVVEGGFSPEVADQIVLHMVTGGQK